jgi:hypothetical protein
MLNSKAGERILACGVAAGAAATLALTGVLPAASAAPAAGSSWRIVKQVHSGDNGGFSAVTAAGKNVIWAFNAGNTPAAWRRTGSTWKKFAIQGPVYSASATSAGNVWAMTASGQVLRWNGTAWVVNHVFHGGGQIGQIEALGAGDVWVFGSAWQHFNGRTWSRVTSGHGLLNVSALSDNDIWAVGSSTVAHWNGHVLTRTSVKNLLPPKGELDDPMLVGIFAQTKHSIWAIGNGNSQDAGGPLFILHDNGRGWRRAIVGGLGSYGGGVVASDGHGGMWIPLNGASGGPTTMTHFSGGKLTTASLPVSGRQIDLLSVTPIPGTTEAIAGGYTHSPDFTNIVSVVLQYGRRPGPLIRAADQGRWPGPIRFRGGGAVAIGRQYPRRHARQTGC